MVTRQQPDLEIPTPTPPRQRSRRGPLLAAAAAVVVILVGVGIALATGAFESGPTAEERLAVATELADTWNQGLEDVDPEVIESVFTDDGVYIDLDGFSFPRKELDSAARRGAAMSNVVRVGELTPSGDNTYTWAVEFDMAGERRRIDWEIELEGDLAVRIEWLRYETVEPASGS